MTEVGQVARGSRMRRARRALQLATCLSLLVLNCSVYDASLLSGSVVLPATDAGDGGAEQQSRRRHLGVDRRREEARVGRQASGPRAASRRALRRDLPGVG